MNVRWIAISLFCTGAYALGCGSSDSDGKGSPCNAVCNCVAKAAGESARTECLSQCADVKTVQACRDRLADNGITSCDAACFAFGDDDTSGSGGSANSGGANASGGAEESGGANASGGSSGSSASGGSGPAGGTVGSGGASAGGVAGTGGSGPIAGSPVGRACTRDTDCGAGTTIKCLLPTGTDFEGDGAPNGYCAADCTANPQACAADPNSVCVRFGTEATSRAFCLEGCTVGGTAAKCHSRADVACDDTGAPAPGQGFCRPTCRGDTDCGARRCDLASGFCTDAPLPPGALPIGSACDPAAATDPCGGMCLPLTTAATGPGMCAGICTLGAFGCGADPNDPNPPKAACLFSLTEADGRRGDLGLCGQLCKCDDECTASGRACRPLPAAEAQAIGWPGYCGGATDPSGAPVEHLACN